VAVGELQLQIATFVHGLDVGEEAIVVGEADVQAASGVYALTRRVEGLDEDKHLLQTSR
jgi:hypothetical protein